MPRLSATAGPKGSTHQLLGAALRCHTRVAHGVSQSSPHAGGRDVSRPQGIFCARLFSAAGSARSWGGRGRALGPSSQDTAHRVTASCTARAPGRAFPPGSLSAQLGTRGTARRAVPRARVSHGCAALGGRPLSLTSVHCRRAGTGPALGTSIGPGSARVSVHIQASDSWLSAPRCRRCGTRGCLGLTSPLGMCYYRFSTEN